MIEFLEMCPLILILTWILWLEFSYFSLKKEVKKRSKDLSTLEAKMIRLERRR